MCALFRFTKPRPSFAEPTQAPPLELKDAQLAAASYGQREGGDLHDYIRVSPERVLFALLDVAGRRDQNRAIVSAAQDALRIIRNTVAGDDDVNEADAMIEICVQMNRAIMKAAGRVCACPTFAGCYNENSGHRLLRKCGPHTGTASRRGRGLRTSRHRFTAGPVLPFRSRCFHRGPSAWSGASGRLARNN